MKPTTTYFNGIYAMLVLALSLTAAVAVATPVTTPEDSTAWQELFQARLEAVKELQQKDIAALRERLDGLDKRIESQLTQNGQAVDRFGIIAGVLGTIVTLLLTLIGAAAYFSVKRKTKAEAEKAAKHWFDAHSAELEQEIEGLCKAAAQAHESMTSEVQGVSKHAQDVHEAIEREQRNIVSPADNNSLICETTRGNDAIVIHNQAEELRKKPEASYSFDDWNTRAFAAYNAGDLDQAVYRWGHAAAVPGAGAANVARALFSKGVVYGKLGRGEEEIRAYGEVVELLGEKPTPSLSIQVANALINKGVALGKLGRGEEEIKVYNEVVERLGENPAPTLRERVANALYNKGVALRQLGREEEAIKAYEEVVERFGKDSAPALREQVAMAFYGIGRTMMLKAKKVWAIDPVAARVHFTTAREMLKQAVTYTNKPDARILGLQAYVEWLSGEEERAEMLMKSAFAAMDGRVDSMYNEILKRIGSPVISGDRRFAELVERLWAEHQATGEP